MLYCKRCDIKYFRAVMSCEKCGGELASGSSVYPDNARTGFKNTGPGYQKILAVLAVAAALIGISLFVLGSLTGFVYNNCREVKEQYSERVPHEADGIYTYYPKYDSLRSFLGEQWSNSIGAYYNYTMTLQNADSDDYYYTVQFLLDTSEHGKINSLVKKLIKAGGNESFEAYFDTDLGEKVDGKFVVYPEPVQKAGKIVRFENVSFTRTVTKCS